MTGSHSLRSARKGLNIWLCFFIQSIQVFIKSELKVGVIYVKENQYTEEEILDNNEPSFLFDEFLQILGERVRLKGNKYMLEAHLSMYCMKPY